MALLALLLAAGCRIPERAQASAPASSDAPATESTWTPSLASAEDPEPAISLTASDGTGLQLVELRARAWVDAPLALTELRLTFANPQARTIEGNFAIQLPPGAAISRFAMKIGDVWQEGEVVERHSARIRRCSSTTPASGSAPASSRSRPAPTSSS